MAPSCLVIVDVQKGFVNRWTEGIPARVAALQDRFDLVAVTRFVNPAGSPYRRLLRWFRFAPGSEDTALAFTPRGDALVVDKSGYSCLVPPLRGWLDGHGIKVVHLCGIATDNCVLKTAVDLFEARFRPVILQDACASHGGPECHEAGLLLLRRFVGREQIVPSDAVIGEI